MTLACRAGNPGPTPGVGARKRLYVRNRGINTSTELAKELGKHRGAISILIDMEKEGFVKCINPEDSSFRHYCKK